jgi:UDP-N-acetylglucosamine--N-acetylmuramyl-(pentapeptide) pyrophosphoryl-undecaprenol N-acetylglucosamine transferase
LKLLIAGGGTGGHVFPALAVALEWLSRDAKRDEIFVGTKRGMESRLIPAAGLKLETIRSAGLKGMRGMRLARNLTELAPGMWDSAAILRRHIFAAAFGVGGYAAGPMMLMATMHGLPSVIFEPNAEPGFTNRVLARTATRIAAAYPAVAIRWGSRAVITGCPVREEFFACGARDPMPPYRILITGGSQGSVKVNRAVIAALDRLVSDRDRVEIVHQAGERDYHAVHEAYAQREFKAEVTPFLSNIAEQVCQADLIICRAGAITVAEIAAAGRAAIFIPFGAATDSHQLRNAQEMVRADAGRLISEPELTGERLAAEIIGLINDPKKIVAMGERARLMARPNAAVEIVNLIEGIARH